MNTIDEVTEQIFRVRRMYPKWFMDPDFYPAKKYLRKRLGKNFVVLFQDSAVRVFWGNESVVI